MLQAEAFGTSPAFVGDLFGGKLTKSFLKAVCAELAVTDDLNEPEKGAVVLPVAKNVPELLAKVAKELDAETSLTAANFPPYPDKALSPDQIRAMVAFMEAFKICGADVTRCRAIGWLPPKHGCDDVVRAIEKIAAAMETAGTKG
jgi:hypothetical protein